jgi:site-specific DNA recombinase
MLNANARRHRTAADHRIAKAPLTGKLFDASGEPMTPTFSRGQSGRAYRYYVSASLQQGGVGTDGCGVRRLSAPAIEGGLSAAVDRWLGRQERPLLPVRAVHLVANGLIVELSVPGSAELALRLESGERILHQTRTSISINVPLALPLRGGQRLVAAGAKRVASPDPTLIAALRKANRIAARESGMPIVRSAPESPYERKILRLAFLAPDLQRDIIAGLHPSEFNLERFMKTDVPLAWPEQRIALGWVHPD